MISIYSTYFLLGQFDMIEIKPVSYALLLASFEDATYSNDDVVDEAPIIIPNIPTIPLRLVIITVNIIS